MQVTYCQAVKLIGPYIQYMYKEAVIPQELELMAKEGNKSVYSKNIFQQLAEETAKVQQQTKL